MADGVNPVLGADPEIAIVAAQNIGRETIEEPFALCVVSHPLIGNLEADDPRSAPAQPEIAAAIVEDGSNIEVTCELPTPLIDFSARRKFIKSFGGSEPQCPLRIAIHCKGVSTGIGDRRGLAANRKWQYLAVLEAKRTRLRVGDNQAFVVF